MSLLAFWRRSFSSLAQTIDMAPTSRTFYKRVLPPTGVAFSSPEGQAIFRDALEKDSLGGFFSVRGDLDRRALALRSSPFALRPSPFALR